MAGATSRTVDADDLEYLGAFRLPEGNARPKTFAYGGEAITFNPNGDPGSPSDGFPGSLFIMGHNRMPYEELPDGNQIAEVSIPIPVISSDVGSLNRATFLQSFGSVDSGMFAALTEIPRCGMEYLDTPMTGPKIHVCWGQHLQDDDTHAIASHAWFEPDLSSPQTQGPWFIGDQSLYSVNDFLFEIPALWAEGYLGGRRLATGRFRDGGWSGMGPSLFAYCPGTDDHGTPALPGAHLPELTLLLYEKSTNVDAIERCMDGYQHPDEWTGGAWITTEDNRSAVLFVGTKSIGTKYWYGYINPAGPDYANVEQGLAGTFTLCRLADGSPCPGEQVAAQGHSSHRGWWSTAFSARFYLFDPLELVEVATGNLQSWEPQPYCFVSIDEHMFSNPSGIETAMLGEGRQRRFRTGDVAYDRVNGLLYLLEPYADIATPVVHVWRVL